MTPAMTDDERQARVDLAACYRLHALNGWTDLIYTHISARVPGAQGPLPDQPASACCSTRSPHPTW